MLSFELARPAIHFKCKTSQLHPKRASRYFPCNAAFILCIDLLQLQDFPLVFMTSSSRGLTSSRTFAFRVALNKHPGCLGSSLTTGHCFILPPGGAGLSQPVSGRLREARRNQSDVNGEIPAQDALAPHPRLVPGLTAHRAAVRQQAQSDSILEGGATRR